MAITISDPDGGLGDIIRAEGDISGADLVAGLKEHLAQDPAKFRRYRYSLSDYTAATRIDLPSSSVKTIARYCREASRINTDAVVTIVASRDFAYGLSRMWEAWLEDTDWETMSFRTRAETASPPSRPAEREHSCVPLLRSPPPAYLQHEDLWQINLPLQ